MVIPIYTPASNICIFPLIHFFPQHLVFSDVIVANLIVGLIYISPIASEGEHLFMYLLAMRVFSKVKMPLSVSFIFLRVA